jgi:hypothetical protein
MLDAFWMGSLPKVCFPSVTSTKNMFHLAVAAGQHLATSCCRSPLSILPLPFCLSHCWLKNKTAWWNMFDLSISCALHWLSTVPRASNTVHPTLNAFIQLHVLFCTVSSDGLKWEAFVQKKTRPCIARDGVMLFWPRVSSIPAPCTEYRKIFDDIKETQMSALEFGQWTGTDSQIGQTYMLY